MKEWAVAINGAGELVGQMQQGLFNTHPDHPLGRMFRVFPGKRDHCVTESYVGGAEFEEPKMISWQIRRPNEEFIFVTEADDELGVFANLQAWLKANGG